MSAPPRDAALLQEYMRAVQAAQTGRWRESADAYLAAYQMPACARWDGHWHVWSGFTSIIRDGRFAATDAHLKALKRVGRDSSAPVLHRAQAHFTRGVARWDGGNREEAARSYHEALGVLSQATPEDRSARVYNTGVQADGSMGLVLQSVSAVLDEIEDGVRGNLNNLRGGSNAASTASAMAEGARRGTQNPVRTMGGGIGPLGDRAENEAALRDAMRRLDVGGDKCDRCGAPPASEDAQLKRCGRCQLAYYCSAECQKAAWKAGHKAACREPGQFEVGDKVQLQGLVSRSELNGQIVEVRGPAPGGTGRIATAMIGGEVEVALKPENMRRLRPIA